MIETNKELRWVRLLLTIIAIPVVVVILKTLKSIFIPLIFAFFLSFVFAPLTSFLKKRHFPLWLIMLITLVIIAIFFSLIILLIYASSNSIVTGLPKYQESFQRLLSDASVFLENSVTRLTIVSKSIPLLDFSQIIMGGSFSVPKVVSNIMSSLVGIFWNLFLILVFQIFILLETGKLEKRFQDVMSGISKDQTLDSMKTIQNQIQNYLIVKSLISLATALVGMGLMLLFGVDFVLVCGIMLFVLNFIPNVGSVLASGIPIVICALQSGLDIRTLMFSILIISTQMFFGNILEPRFQSERQNLTPIIVLISLIFWGWLWGFVGMLICVPLTSAINIILKQIDPQNIVSALISSSNDKHLPPA